MPDNTSDVHTDESADIVCPCCGVQIGEDRTLHDGEPHCLECVHTCESCDCTTTDSSDIAPAYTHGGWSHLIGQRGNERECVCSECRWTCADCDNEFTNAVDVHRNSSDDPICERCYQNYTTCEECDRTIHVDDSFYSDSTERHLCESCYDSEESESDLLHQYDYKPTAEFTLAAGEKRLPDTLFFGIELEVDHRQQRDRGDDIGSANIPDLFYCKEDGSLDNGFEIVSHPATWEHWKAFEWKFLGDLRSAGYRSFNTKTCGMHIHVSRKCLSELQQFKLLNFFRHNPTFIKRLSRRFGIQAKQLDAYARVDDTKHTKQLIRKVKRGPDRRYEAINLENKKTLEFRFFRGTLDVAAIQRNISLAVALVRFVQTTGIRQDCDYHFIKWVKREAPIHIGSKAAKALYEWVKSPAESNDTGA